LVAIYSDTLSICGVLMSTARDESMIGTFRNSIDKSAGERLGPSTLATRAGEGLERTDERD
jgi:hypothetical protein